LKRIFFFATPGDILPVLKRFETNAPLKYIKLGNDPTPDRPYYLSGDTLPNPGIATHETGGRSGASYMVTLSEDSHDIYVQTRTINTGEKRWILNNSDNENTVCLGLACLWKDMLLPGIMDTMHNTPKAQQLMKWFNAALKKEGFTKVDLYWLGPEALAMLKAGKRLSKTAEQSPPAYDLKLPDNLK
jgi:hypothetical protein